MGAKAKKGVRERNTLPSNISWKNQKDVDALTNNQLKMYFETRWSQDNGLKISGSKADLTKRVLSSHARRNAARYVLEDEEFLSNSCEAGTTSESESSDSDVENRYVEESFEILFVSEKHIQYVNYVSRLCMREPMFKDNVFRGISYLVANFRIV